MAGKSQFTPLLACTREQLLLHKGDYSAAAAALGISLGTLYSRIQQLTKLGRNPYPRPSKKPVKYRTSVSGEQLPKTRLAEADDPNWLAYWANPGDETRNALIMQYLYLVQGIARKIVNKLPPETFTDEEFVNFGVTGLQEAIAGYDLSRGYKFSTYAVVRIRGSMIDALRAIDSVPRLERTKERQFSAVRARLKQLRGGDVNEEEVRDALGWDCHVPLEAGRPRATSSLDQTLFSTDGGEVEMTHLDMGAAKIECEQEAEVHHKLAVLRMLQGLSFVERTLLYLYYCRGCTMKQIGVVLHLSESRVSQCHTRVVAALKSRFDDQRMIA